MSGQGREEKGLFPKGMILACVILFLLGIGCVGMNLAAGPSEEKIRWGRLRIIEKRKKRKRKRKRKSLKSRRSRKKYG